MEDNNLNNEEVSNIVNENNNVDINEQNNNIEQNNENINYIKQNNSSSVPIIIMFIILLLFVFVFLGNNSNLFSNSNKQEQNNELIDDSQKDDNSQQDKEKDNIMLSLTVDLDGGIDNVDYKEKYKKGEEIELTQPTREGYRFIGWKVNNWNVLEGKILVINYDVTVKALWRKNSSGKINYEIKETIDDDIKTIDLYVDNVKTNVSTQDYFNSDTGRIEVKEYKDVLIVDSYSWNNSRNLIIVDNNGNATTIDYKVSEYKDETTNYGLSDEIESYRLEGNNLYVKVNRYSEWNSFWFCKSKEDEIAAYEIKFEYLDGDFVNRQIVNEINVQDKYKNIICDINVKNSYTKDQIKNFVNDFPYSKTLDSEYNYNEMWASYIINSFFKVTKSVSVLDEMGTSGNISIYDGEKYTNEDGYSYGYLSAMKSKDSNGVKYPKYKYTSTEHIYMSLGLSVDEISKKEYDINNFCGPCSTSVMDGEKLRKEIEKVYGNHNNIFNNSFEIKINYDISSNVVNSSIQYLYDKSMDKVMKKSSGGGMSIPKYYKVEILDEKEENNEYKVQFVDSYFVCESFGNCSKLSLTKDDKSKEIIEVYTNSNDYEPDEKFKTEYKNILRKNQDKLNKYEVVFEKLNDGYTYKSIRKIENNG